MMAPMTRRGFVSSMALAGTAVLLDRGLLRAQQVQQQVSQPELVLQARALGAKAKVTTQSLRGNVSVLTGAGGNIAVLTGRDGKLLVDSGYMTCQPQITEALAGLGSDPLKHLVNTHWHYDHTDGNEWMHAAGASILAQAKTRERLSTPQEIAMFHTSFPAAPAGAIPQSTFDEAKTLDLNGESIRLAHYQPAHTDTDASIYFVHADVLHTGDTWFNETYPFIDYSTGGSIDGMIKASETTLTLVSSKTILIPGHGPTGDRTQLAAFHEMLIGSRAAVAAQKKSGKTLDETIQAKPLAAYDAKYGNGFMKPEVFVTLVYQGV